MSSSRQRFKFLRNNSIFYFFLKVFLLLILKNLAFAQKAELVLPVAHAANITAMAFSPDGQYIATGSENGVLKLWETALQRPICAFEVASNINQIGFNANGTALFAAAGGTISWFDLRTRRLLSSSEIGTKEAGHVVFSPDLSLMATGSTEGWIKIHQLDNKSLKLFERGHSSNISAMVFSQNNKYLASTSRYSLSQTKIWDVQNGQQLIRLPINQIPAVMEFSRDGKVLAVVENNQVRLFEVETGKQIKVLRTQNVNDQSPISLLFFLEDGRRLLASIPAKNQIIGWDLENGREFDLLAGQKLAASILAFSPKGDFLAAANAHQLQFWNLKENRPGQNEVWSKPLRSVRLSPDNSRLLLFSQKRTLQIWDFMTGKLIDLPTSNYGESAYWRQFDFSADSSQVASFTNLAIRIWDSKTGAAGKTFNACKSVYGGEVSFSPANKLILCNSSAYRASDAAQVYDLATGKKLWEKETNEHGGGTPLFSADGKTVISVWGKAIYLYETDISLLSKLGQGLRARGLGLKLPEGKAGLKLLTEILELKYEYELYRVNFLKWVTQEEITQLLESVWAGLEGNEIPPVKYINYYPLKSVKIWDAQTGRELKSFSEGQIHGFKLSRDGRTLAVTWNNVSERFSRISLFDVESGKKLYSWKFDYWIDSLERFSFDGKYLKFKDFNRVNNTSRPHIIEIATGKETTAKAKFYGENEIVIDTGKSGETRFLKASTNQHLGSLFIFDQEWIFRTPDGRFDASAKISDSLYGVEGLKVISVKKLKPEKFTPNLAAKALGISNKPEVKNEKK